jgi:hypothetical protein
MKGAGDAGDAGEVEDAKMQQQQQLALQPAGRGVFEGERAP